MLVTKHARTHRSIHRYKQAFGRVRSSEEMRIANRKPQHMTGTTPPESSLIDPELVGIYRSTQMEAGGRLAFPSAHVHLPLKAAAERTKLDGTCAGNVCKV